MNIQKLDGVTMNVREVSDVFMNIHDVVTCQESSLSGNSMIAL